MGGRVNYVLVRDGKHTVYAQGGGYGGLRNQLDANVTAEEIEHIAALLRG